MDGFDVHSKFWYLTPEGLSLSSVSPPEGEKTGKRRLRETEKGRLKLYDLIYLQGTYLQLVCVT